MSLNLGILASSRQQSAPLLLDTYLGATAAYSLRKLRTAYTGPAIRVRRSSDFTETNIGFVNNVLDTASLLTFVGAGSGFVTIWYDQSGNGSNAVQSAMGNQPIIVDSGVLVTENTKPSLNFSGRDMPLGTIISSNTNLSIFATQRTKTTTSSGIVLGHSSGGGSGPFFGITNSNKYAIQIAINGVSKNGASVANAGIAFNILNTIVNSVDAYPYINDTLIPITLNTWTPSTTDFTQIGKYFIFGSDMNLSELIIYKTDQSSNRIGIVNNTNSFYSVFTPQWAGNGTALLDLYPSASAAYSLRNLSSTYIGPLVRVRRSSDNVEQDFYGTYLGVLDTSSIITFCGTSEGFITIWYDQSGIGVNAIQNTLAAQPKIYSYPNLYLQNGKPSIKFDGNSYNLRRTGTMPLIERSFTFVGKQDFYQQDAGVFGFAPSGGGNDFNSPDTFILQTANSSVPADYYVVGSTGASYFLPQNGPGTTAVLQYGLYLENKTTSVGELYRNNSLIAQDSSFTQFNASNTQSLVLGARQFNSSLLTGHFAGLFQEFVYWSVSNTANRLGIQNNINSYYTIY